jgi:hypothetical protein
MNKSTVLFIIIIMLAIYALSVLVAKNNYEDFTVQTSNAINNINTIYSNGVLRVTSGLNVTGTAKINNLNVSNELNGTNCTLGTCTATNTTTDTLNVDDLNVSEKTVLVGNVNSSKLHKHNGYMRIINGGMNISSWSGCDMGGYVKNYPDFTVRYGGHDGNGNIYMATKGKDGMIISRVLNTADHPTSI